MDVTSGPVPGTGDPVPWVGLPGSERGGEGPRDVQHRGLGFRGPQPWQPIPVSRVPSGCSGHPSVPRVEAACAPPGAQPAAPERSHPEVLGPRGWGSLPRPFPGPQMSLVLPAWTPTSAPAGRLPGALAWPRPPCPDGLTREPPPGGAATQDAGLRPTPWAAHGASRATGRQRRRMHPPSFPALHASSFVLAPKATGSRTWPQGPSGWDVSRACRLAHPAGRGVCGLGNRLPARAVPSRHPPPPAPPPSGSGLSSPRSARPPVLRAALPGPRRRGRAHRPRPGLCTVRASPVSPGMTPSVCTGAALPGRRACPVLLGACGEETLPRGQAGRPGGGTRHTRARRGPGRSTPVRPCGGAPSVQLRGWAPWPLRSVCVYAAFLWRAVGVVAVLLTAI